MLLLWIHRARVSLLLLVVVPVLPLLCPSKAEELSTLLVLKRAVCLSVAYQRTEMQRPLRHNYEY